MKILQIFLFFTIPFFAFPQNEDSNWLMGLTNQHSYHLKSENSEPIFSLQEEEEEEEVENIIWIYPKDGLKRLCLFN